MQVTLDVKGMTSEDCETKVKNALEQLDGVQTVETNFGTGKVDVAYDEVYVTVAELRETVEHIGYDVII